MRAERTILSILMPAVFTVGYLSDAGYASLVGIAERLHARTGRLTLHIGPGSVAEDGSNPVATVTRTGYPLCELVVSVSSSDLTELHVPPIVTIPAGKSSVRFVVEVVNDGDTDGDQTAAVSATAVGYDVASQTVSIQDDDDPNSRTIGGHLFGRLDSNAYTVVSDIVVDVGQTLEIEPGSTLGFGPGLGLLAKGSLLAKGRQGGEIVFTASVDSPQPGEWNGIRIEGKAGQNSVLDHVEIAFATDGISILSSKESPKVAISNSRVHDSSSTGIYVMSRPGKPIRPANCVQILKSRIYDNGLHGIKVESLSQGRDGSSNHATVTGNQIYGNGNAGIYLYANDGSRAWSWPRRPGMGAWIWWRKSSVVASEISGNVIHNNQTGICGVAQASLNRMAIEPQIMNNMIYANTRHGLCLLAGKGQLGARIVNNTIAANGEAGILQSARNCERFSITNNIVAGNGRGIEASYPFNPYAFNDCTVAYNNVYDSNDGNWVRYPARYGDLTNADLNGTPADVAMNISTDPCFVEPGYWDANGTPEDANDDFWVDGDYHLLADSLCVDAGDPNGQYDGLRDMDGRARVVGAAIDIGADEQDCFPSADRAYADWLAAGGPDCWCYPRQCHGDADGRNGGGTESGLSYVGPSDMNILISAWLVKEPPKGPGIGSIPNGICADFAHDTGGSAKVGLYRVGPADLNVLIANWLVREPPHGPGVPADCGGTLEP